MRFPMTLGGLTKVTTVSSLLLLGLMLPFQYFMVLRHLPGTPAKVMGGVLLLAVAGTLLFTVALAPRAVRVDGHRLVVERLLWPDFVQPLRQVTGVEAGPEITLRGRVRRVAGNGGLMGFTGLFRVSEVGLVRCWATRMGVPTVLVYRGQERPLLLGVDDPAGLLRSLRRYSGRS